MEKGESGWAEMRGLTLVAARYDDEIILEMSVQNIGFESQKPPFNYRFHLSPKSPHINVKNTYVFIHRTSKKEQTAFREESLIGSSRGNDPMKGRRAS